MKLASTLRRVPTSWPRSSTPATAPRLDAAESSARASSRFDLALFSGGDERVLLDPVTGRTKYGTPHGCAEDEAWFSSSTGTAISARGYAAAAQAWQTFFAGNQTLAEGFDEIRQRLTGIFGIEGTQAILAGSGTEAVLISLALARMVCRSSVTAIIVGCAETGRGVSAAAAGLHFVRQAAFAAVTPGDRLTGFETMDINVDTVAIRDRGGALRPPGEVDAELARKAEAARRAGRDVIIHRLEASKTGYSAPSLAVLDRICKAAPGQVLVLADACQLRCSAAHIQSLLHRGYLVSLTGSKFAGGPPFAGALLVPPAVMRRLRPMPLPAGLAAYSAQLDWPPTLRRTLSLGFLPLTNVGLALRWQAALAEIEHFFACPPDLCRSIFAQFRREVVRRVGATPCLDVLPSPAETADSWGHSILCVVMRHTDGRCFDMAEAGLVQQRLREGHEAGTAPTKRFHLGQPVAVGGAGALRVCASAALVNRVADAAAEVPFSEAWAPVGEDLAALFTAWPAAVKAVAGDPKKIDAL